MKCSIYRPVEAGGRIGKKIAREDTFEWCYMYSVLIDTGKGLVSTLKEHPKSKPHADQNQDKDVKL